MRALHLKRIGETWHYQRRRPKSFVDVEPRRLIRFSLKTTDYSKARALAANFSLDIEQKWKEAKRLGISLKSDSQLERFAAAHVVNQNHGVDNISSTEFSDEELLKRLKLLIANPSSEDEQKAVLGLIERPKISLSKAFERFWNHIRDERIPLGEDQQRIKRNVFIRAIGKFEQAVGEIPINEITRKHAMLYRDWCIKQVESKNVSSPSLNKEIGALRRIISINFEIDGIETTNPFHQVRLKDVKQQQRKPFSTQFILESFIKSAPLSALDNHLVLLVRIMINTGARPSELIGLESGDINLETEIPYIYIRRNETRSLKTDHSERQIPLLGVSLNSARVLEASGGWGKWLGKNMYATTVINKFFREHGLVTESNQSLYSLRHWFQDQLTKHDVIDRAQAQLMGHKFQRPLYGLGKELSELKQIIEKFAL